MSQDKKLREERNDGDDENPVRKKKSVREQQRDTDCSYLARFNSQVILSG